MIRHHEWLLTIFLSYTPSSFCARQLYWRQCSPFVGIQKWNSPSVCESHLGKYLWLRLEQSRCWCGVQTTGIHHSRYKPSAVLWHTLVWLLMIPLLLRCHFILQLLLWQHKRTNVDWQCPLHWKREQHTQLYSQWNWCPSFVMWSYGWVWSRMSW